VVSTIIYIIIIIYYD